MATQTTTGADAFYKQLGRMYGTYTGGFVAFVVLLAILEQVGVPNRILGYFFVFFTLAVYAIIGVATRTAQISEYYVAGRRVPAFYNGMATGADWMSAASFVGMAGTLFLLGYDGLAWVLGWTGGFVLVSILVGPYLRKFGAYTVPDFLSFRYGGNFARFLGVIVLVCCSFTYVTAQIYGTGIIASRFLGMQFEIAVFAGLVGILLCAMLGGMRAVTWTQIAQYIVLIVAYLTPIVILSTQHFGIPIPELTYGKAIAEITAREQQLVKDGLAVLCTHRPVRPGTLKPHIQPFMNYTALNFFGIIFCMMVGTASLPHILMRYFTTPSVKEARDSVAWSLLFIFLLYFSAPAYAAFSKLEVYTNIIGSNIDALRPWIFQWGELGLIQICGKNAASLQSGHRCVQGDRRAPRRAAVPGLRDQHGRDRALHAGDRGPSVRDLGPGRRGRPRGGALHRRRLAARHRQCAQPRHLLQDARPECADHPPAHGRARASVLRRRGCGRAGRNEAIGHPGHGGLGVLARHGREFSGDRAGHLVETRHHDRRHLRDYGRLGHLPVLSRGVEIFPADGGHLFRHDLAAQSGDGSGADQRRSDHGRPEMACRRAGERSQPAGQQGRLVRPQQHQLRIAGHAARLPGDLSSSACSARSRRRRCKPTSTRSASRAAGRCSKKRSDGTSDRARTGSKRGPVSFWVPLPAVACRWSQRRSSVDHRRERSSTVSPSYPILTYWYFHLPNFILAALMYTLLGRALLALIVQPDSTELHLAVLLPHHRSVRRAYRRR